ASKTNYFFDALQVQVTPNTPKLPDIKPVRICVECVAFYGLSGRKAVLNTKDAPISTRSMSATADADGSFCFRVSSGVHTIQVSDSESTFIFKDVLPGKYK
ncbi:predicted protein, partial [Nematostella vectensis]